MVDPSVLHKYNCNEDKVCGALTGVFNCSLGHCANMSELFLCHYKADGITVDSDKDNLKLNGFFECHKSRCIKIKNTRNFYCERYCPLIATSDNNLYIQEGNSVHAGRCESVRAHVTAHGVQEEAAVVWRGEPVLLASCNTVTRVDGGLNATDCLNGTLLNATLVPRTMMNFTTYRHLVEASNISVDNEHRFLPPQHTLTIYNHSRLYINLDGCVNTLRGECRQFLSTHGNDGDNFTAQSRFPCFYNKNNSFLVVARFDLNKTWRELVIAVAVPSTLFVVSFIALVVIAHSVQVGDDAKMRWQPCGGRQGAADPTEELVMDSVGQRDSLAVMEVQANTTA